MAEIMEKWGFFVFLWFVFGVIGLVLGNIVGKKEGAGFFLGLFLGPLGWIIVFLLPSDQGPKVVSTTPGKGTPRPERDLESDAYKVWLGNTYNIKKNELFEKYEFDGNLFETLDDALSYVDQKDREKGKAERKNLENVKIEAEKLDREEPWVIIGISILLIAPLILAALIFL